MPVLYFRMDDGGVHQTPGMIRIDPRDAQKWNEEQWGIFWTVNEFGEDQKVENLEKIRAWYVDVDLTDPDEKPRVLEALLEAELKPSLIVETKRGFHAYWRAKCPSLEGYKPIQKGLSSKFRGDNLSNVNRVLRVPNMVHWKKLDHPYLVETVYQAGHKYTEQEMSAWLEADIPSNDHNPTTVIRRQSDGSVFGKMGDMDCREALLKLSGHSSVKGEKYSFRENFDGSYQIIVNGKSSGAWIDREGYIGSYDGGGPTIVQWLKWFGHDWGTIAMIGEKVLL
jgi:hypothetical protein